MTLNAAIIGAGRVGQNHAEAYVGADGVELRALADVDDAQLAESGDRFGVPAGRRYRSYEELLAAERPDVVSVATPARAHHGHVRDVVERRPDVSVVWCEKPIATTVARAEAMVAACDAAGVELLVGHVRRFSYAHEALRDLLDTGELLGTVGSVHLTADGEVLNVATHYVDLLLYLLDAGIDEVRGGSVETVRWNGETRYAGGGTLALDDGTVAHLDRVQGAPHRLAIRGTGGSLSVPLSIAPDADTSWRYWRPDDGAGTRARPPEPLQELWEEDIEGTPRGYEPGDVPAQSLFDNAAGHVVDLAAGERDNAAPGSRAAHGLAGLAGLVTSAALDTAVPLPLAEPLRGVSLARDA